jgi:hypothetical protein
MAKPNPIYKRLRGTGYRQMIPTWGMLLLFLVIGVFVLLLRGKRVQLWRAEDHLLVVEWTGAKEYYKRIQFSDIQWTSIHRTDAHIGTTGVLVTLLLLFGIVSFLSPEPLARYTFLVLAFLVLGLLAAHLAAGPTCKAYLATAVQVEELVSLTRMRKAQKVFAMLRPAILQAQSSLTHGDAAITAEAAQPAPEAEASTVSEANPAPGLTPPAQ